MGITNICTELQKLFGLTEKIDPVTLLGTVPAFGSSNAKSAFRDMCTRELEGQLTAFRKRGADINGLLIILPAENANSLYSEIKWWGDCSAGIPTTCITDVKLLKAGRGDEGLCQNLR